MTSEKKEAGAWAVCTSADMHIPNAEPEPNQKLVTLFTAEALRTTTQNTSLHPFGIHGYAFSAKKKANGVSFYGVTVNLTVEYLQAYKGSDDGFEFFSGSGKRKYLVATDCSATTHSTGQKAGTVTDNSWLLIRATKRPSVLIATVSLKPDNNGKNAAATPVSGPYWLTWHW